MATYRSVAHYLASLSGTEFPDDTFRVQDNGDPTKEIAFEASAITGGTTRTITMADANIALLKQNLSAGADPAVGDDSDDGYAVGSLWVNTTDDKAFVCLDASVGAAVWTEVTQAGGGGGGSNLAIDVRKASAGTIPAQAPVYVAGYNAAGWYTVEQADSDGTGTMPAVGLAAGTITNSATVELTMLGTLEAVDTSSWSSGDALYVGSAGVLTSTRPPGDENKVQKIATVGRSHATLGTMLMAGALRSNDVPNIAEREVWAGDSTGVAEAVMAWRVRSNFLTHQAKASPSSNSLWHIMGASAAQTGTAGSRWRVADGATMQARSTTSSTGTTGFSTNPQTRFDCLAGGWAYGAAVIASGGAINAMFATIGFSTSQWAVPIGGGLYDNDLGVYFQYDFSVDGNWHCITKSDTQTDGTNTTDSDSGVAVSTTDGAFFEIRFSDDSATAYFFINRVLVATHTTDLPAASAGNNFFFNVTAKMNSDTTNRGVSCAEIVVHEKGRAA